MYSLASPTLTDGDELAGENVDDVRFKIPVWRNRMPVLSKFVVDGPYTLVRRAASGHVIKALGMQSREQPASFQQQYSQIPHSWLSVTHVGRAMSKQHQIGRRRSNSLHVKSGGIRLSVNTVTRKITVKHAEKSWSQLTHPDMILIPTFERVFIMDSKKEQKEKAAQKGLKLYSAYLKRPSTTMNDIGCDRCAGPHSAKTALCSANLRVISPFVKKQAGFYLIKTGERVKPQPKIVSEQLSQRDTVRQVQLLF